MKISIRQLASGVAGPANTGRALRFDVDELPDGLRRRARQLLAPDRIAGESRSAGDGTAADAIEYEIEIADVERSRRLTLSEADCPPELLDLLDELRETLG